MLLPGTLRDLHRFDDYTIHQMSGPISRVENDGSTWFDRCIFEMFSLKDKVYLAAGLGVYPNAGIMDGFVEVVRGTTQTNVRVSRRLHNDRDTMKVGPLAFKVVKPMEKWSLKLGKNEYGLSFDLEWKGAYAPAKIRDVRYPRPGGGPDMVWTHFFQNVIFNGSIVIDGTVIPVTDWRGARDKSWGERRIFEGGYGFYLWLHMPFSDHGIDVFYMEEMDGTPIYCDGAVTYDSGEQVRIVNLRHRLEFEPGTVRHTSGKLVLVHPDGSETVVKTKRLFQGGSLLGAGYKWRQGFDLGESHIEGDSWDINADHARTMPADTPDQICQYDDGKEKVQGVFELAWINVDYQYRPTL